MSSANGDPRRRGRRDIGVTERHVLRLTEGMVGSLRLDGWAARSTGFEAIKNPFGAFGHIRAAESAGVGAVIFPLQGIGAYRLLTRVSWRERRGR